MTLDKALAWLRSQPDNSVSGFSYDATGRVVASSNHANKTAYFKYDVAGNLTHTWGDTPNPVRTDYNELGQKTKLHTYRSGTWTGAALPAGFALDGDVTTWNYQATTGLMTSKQDAINQTTSYQYDALGRSTKRTDARGWVTNYSYTAAGQPLTTDYTDAVTTDVTYTYDRAGRATSVADLAGTRSFAYYDTWSDATYDNELRNKSARVKSETLPAYFGSHAINYDYQYSVAGRANGALASLKLDTGSLYTVSYGFDAVGRLGTVTSNLTATPFTYAYVANANLIDTVAQGTTGYKRDYDYQTTSNRVSVLKNQFASVSASTVESRLTYDLLGQRNTEKIAGANWLTALGRPGEPGVHADYQYTDRHELDYSAKFLLTSGWGAGAFKANTDRDYTYDPMGNRTADTTAGLPGSYAPNALNQYTIAPGAPAMSYDANGNLTNDGTRGYEYDGENRLIKVTQAGSLWNYSYDYMGRRIRKWGTGLTEQRFIYDGWNLIAETDASGNLTRRYAWGLDVSGTMQGAGGVGGLLMIQDGSATYYPLYDASHNVIGLYNASGGIDSAYEYDPFGKLQTSAGTYAAANPFRFSTKYTDNETSFTYYGHRYYSSTLGRFINRDPIEEAGGLNLYGFCGNDGVNGYDYLGMADGQEPDTTPAPDPVTPQPTPTPPPPPEKDETSHPNDTGIIVIVNPDGSTIYTPAGVTYVYGSGENHQSIAEYDKDQKIQEQQNGNFFANTFLNAGTYRDAIQLHDELKHEDRMGWKISGYTVLGVAVTAATLDVISNATGIKAGIKGLLKFGAKAFTTLAERRAAQLAANKLAGRSAERLVAQALEEKGIQVIGSQVGMRTSKGMRYIDHLVKLPTGEIVAVEVKSGNAARNALQLAKDAEIAAGRASPTASMLETLSDALLAQIEKQGGRIRTVEIPVH